MTRRFFIPATNDHGWPRRPLLTRVRWALARVPLNPYVMPPCPHGKDLP